MCCLFNKCLRFNNTNIKYERHKCSLCYMNKCLFSILLTYLVKCQFMINFNKRIVHSKMLSKTLSMQFPLPRVFTILYGYISSVEHQRWYFWKMSHSFYVLHKEKIQVWTGIKVTKWVNAKKKKNRLKKVLLSNSVPRCEYIGKHVQYDSQNAELTNEHPEPTL